MSSSENLPASSDHTLTSQQSGYPTRSSATGQSLDITKQDFTSQVSPGNVSAYGSATSYQSQKTSYQGSSAAPNSYNAYSSNSQTAQSSFPSVTGNNYSTTTTVAQPSYNTSSTYPQSNASTYSQSSPSVAASASTGYNQSVANNQVCLTLLYFLQWTFESLIEFMFLFIVDLSAEWLCRDDHFAIPGSIRSYKHCIEHKLGIPNFRLSCWICLPVDTANLPAVRYHFLITNHSGIWWLPECIAIGTNIFFVVVIFEFNLFYTEAGVNSVHFYIVIRCTRVLTAVTVVNNRLDLTTIS